MRSRVGNMLRLCAAFAAISAFVTMGARAQGDQDKGDKPAAEKPHPVSKSGKKLLGTDDILRIKSISGAKLSPDGAHVAFTASTVETNPDEPSEEWKSRTELWIVPLAGPDTAARQYTHPEQNVASPTWSPDGKRIAFLRGRSGARHLAQGRPQLRGVLA
jgi:dipeptidyl aminopeptidase/acylaminoacyl peptidase